ncbi:MAG: RsmE family RNA methyltransferase [Candidatus Eremiobacteraeota bacterium]|nr:RsmE family RNA methyltransferase [Candidatus Eremiobacteraeota bacterium]
MSRIFIPNNIINLDPLIITGEIHHHISRVLRLHRGDTLQAICGDGFLYDIQINNVKINGTFGEIIEKEFIDIEPRLNVTLYQGMLKGKKIEEMISPLVQLGLSRFVPIHTKRCENRLMKLGMAKINRYEKIIQWATALSGRTHLMKMEQPLSFQDAMTDIQKNDFNLIFWESALQIPLKKQVEKVIEGIGNHKKISVGIFIGPEGGFTEGEVVIAQELNIVPASLGKRIIEAGKAPIIAVTSLLVISCDI